MLTAGVTFFLPIRHKWACHATHNCRTQGRLITRGVNGRNTYSASNHLVGQHNISVPKTEWGGKERRSKKHKLMCPHPNGTQPPFPSAQGRAAQQARNWLLMAVHTYITGLLLPPDHFELARVNNFLRAGGHPLEVEKLNRIRVTHLVGELYLAKLDTISTALNCFKAKSQVPLFHLSIDILKVVNIMNNISWGHFFLSPQIHLICSCSLFLVLCSFLLQHDTHKERYLSIRVYWIDDQWILHSELLAVRILQVAKYKTRAQGQKLMIDFIDLV